MMNDLLSVIREFKELQGKKILTLLLSGIILTWVYKFDILIDKYMSIKSQSQIRTEPKKTQDQNGLLRYIDNTTLSNETLEIIQNYLNEYITRYPQQVHQIAIFRFLPPGDEYSYQGRFLVGFKSRKWDQNQENRFKHELGITWIPLGSGKEQMQHITDNEIYYQNYSDKDNKFISNYGRPELSGLNLDLLLEYDIMGIYRYPIVSGKSVVGYIGLYSTKEITQNNEREYQRISQLLAQRIQNYLRFQGKQQ